MPFRLKPAAGWINALTARLGKHVRFWRLRQWAQKLGFGVRRRLFVGRHSGSEVTLTARAGRDALRRSWLPVLAAVAVVGLLGWIDPRLRGWVEWVGLEKTWVADAVDRTLSPGSYDALLTAIAGVGGVFIALYFTAVSNVVATVYASVPQGVRELIAADRYGNVYIRFISFLTVVAVLLLAVSASGVEPYRLAAPLLAVSSGVAIFAFAQLGRRTFYLADPSHLAGEVRREFQRWFLRAKAGGWQWQERSFQEHYHRRARAQIVALAGLVDVAREQEHLRGESLGRVIRYTFRLLTFHVASKPAVPTSSRWFGERQRHKQWYVTSGLEVGLAATTGGVLQPQSEPDWNWAEDQLLPKLVDALESEIGAGRLEAAYASLSVAIPLWTAFGQTWSVAEARRWSEGLVDACTAALGDQPPRETTARTVAVRTAIADALGNLPVAAELGLFHALRTADTSGLRIRLASLDWNKPRTPYSLGLPRPVLAAVEAAQRSLEFEREVGALYPTPGWYVAERALREMAAALKSELDTTVTFARTWYVSAFDRFEAAGRYYEASAVLIRGLESVTKLKAHLFDFKAFAEDLEKGRLLEDTIWPIWDWKGLRSQIEDLQWELQLRQARSIAPLALEPATPEVPDFLGQAMHQTGELCFDALFEPDPDKFERIFPLYFAGMFAIFERVREEARELRPEVGVYWIAEPMLELVDISGHALICAELHRMPELWTRCRECWEKVIPEAENLLPAVAASIASQSLGRMASPRTMLRSQRAQAMEQRLQDVVGIEAGDLDFGSEVEVVHPSPLVRLLCRDGMQSLLLPSDVFVVRYLMTLERAEKLDFGLDEWRAQDLSQLDDEPPAKQSDEPEREG